MGMTYGILLFDGAEELDAVGPWEVFTMATMEAGAGDLPDAIKGSRVVSISESGDTVTCAKGMRIEPDYSIEDCPKLDVLLIPGGVGTRREVDNPALLAWISKISADCAWVTSVCTGALLLVAAGPAKGKRVTTHWSFIEALKSRGDCDVQDHIRYVRDGNIVTAAGVSAGIDMALWLVGEIYGPDHARRTQRYMEYDPAPPYAGAV